ncbi:O-antigen ligase family protein [Vibrio viridaestus]|uniref:O-antigen ligase family protein n=1 Tax=Vibrio viridaestus TaxID=2487322 RepID=A0A3N9TC07_9VIBR|nr:O-antigen ligase family protein [Vibrio viridaestus]RQW61727.1 O-antigen ligase family protein [Vibrio viridaestus]
MNLLQKMDIMNHFSKNNKALLFLLFLLGVSCLVSKSGLYIFSSLLLLYFIFSFDVKKIDIKKPLIVLSALSFLIGILAVLFRQSSMDEIVFFLKKSSFLILFPIALYYFRFNPRSLVLLAGGFIGLVIANIKAISIYLHSGAPLTGSLIQSFWDIGRWRELLSYAIVIAIPFLFSKRKYLTIISCIVIVPSLFSIILSGGRLPYVAVGIVTSIYFIIFQRRLFIYYILIILLGSALLYFSNSSISQAVEQRVVSIFDTQKNDSNLGRLTMYQQGLNFILHNLQHNPKDFLLGFGEENFQQYYTRYLSDHTDINELNQKTSNQFSYTDHHDAYLNTLSKRGFLYFICFYLLLYKMVKESYQLSKGGDPFYQASYNLIVCYLIAGLFYSNSFSFQTTIFFLFWAALFSKGTVNRVSSSTVEVAK